MSPKSVARALGGLILAAFLLWWVLRDTDPATLWETIRNVSWPLMGLCVLFNVGHNVFGPDENTPGGAIAFLSTTALP